MLPVGQRGFRVLMEEKHWSLVHIPGYEETDAGSTVEVLAADIEPKQASILIRELNAVAPLPNFNHVKRVRRNPKVGGGVDLSIILCVRRDGSDGELIVPSEVTELVVKHELKIFTVKISKYAASSREEWDAQCQLWPTHFHPNCARPTRLEFDEDEVRKVSKFMRQALDQASLARKHGQLANAAVIVDPALGEVIASAYDESRVPSCSNCSSCTGRWHPLRHAAVVAIDKASERDRSLFPDENQRAEMQEASEELEAAAKRQRVELPTIEVQNGRNSDTHSVEVSRPYLCTGFDIYLVREPCAMCAMAMVHQRFRRVIYGLTNPTHGALGGKFYLHRQQSLNHHYTVIQVSLSNEILRRPAPSVIDDADAFYLHIRRLISVPACRMGTQDKKTPVQTAEISSYKLANAAVIVDPAIGQVIAGAYDESRLPSYRDCSSCTGRWQAPFKTCSCGGNRCLFPHEKQCAEMQEASEELHAWSSLSTLEGRILTNG